MNSSLDKGFSELGDIWPVSIMDSTTASEAVSHWFESMTGHNENCSFFELTVERNFNCGSLISPGLAKGEDGNFGFIAPVVYNL